MSTNSLTIWDSNNRTDFFRYICASEVEQLIQTSVAHFAIPIIAGFSMDDITQEQFIAMGGAGPKPEPLKPEVKLKFYKRIDDCIRKIIFHEAKNLVNEKLSAILKNLTTEDLKKKAIELRDRVKTDTTPDWSKVSSLFADHLCFFKELKGKINMDPIVFHDQICPIMEEYRDSGQLFQDIPTDE